MRVFALIIFALLINAKQSLKAQDFGFSIYAGLNASQISGDDLFGFYKIGAYGGIGTSMPIIDDNWRVEFGLLFSQKGSYSGPSSNTGYRYLLNVNYIDIPIGIGRNVLNDFWIEAGPSINTMIGYRENTIQGPANDPREFSRFDISVFAGLEYEVNDRFSVLARFSNSVLPVRPHRSGAVRYYNRGQYHTYISAAAKLHF